MRAELRAAIGAFRLAMPQGIMSGLLGERAGKGVGSSMELLELRDYVPGDDIRHIDWRAYARSDRLLVRQYQAEVAPWVDVVVDTSASMASTERKARALSDLVGALCFWSRAAGARPRLLRAGGGPIEEGREEAPRGVDSATLVPLAPMRPQAVRVVVSDFLRPIDASRELSRIGASGSRTFVVQLLDPWELDPTAEGSVELVDAELPYKAELELDEVAIAAYKRRLTRLQDGVRDATRALGGRFACVAAGEPDAMARGELLRAGIVEPLP